MFLIVETGKNVTLLRKALGLSQEQAALKSDISPACWRKIENGCGNATVNTLWCAARTLQVPPFTLGILSGTDGEILSMLRKPPGRFCAQPEKRPQLGKNVVLLRKARGLSQKELACRAHVSAAYLRELEHGCANPTMELLGRIAESLEVSMLVLGALTLPDSAVLDAVHRVRAAAKLEKVSPEDLLVL